MITTIIFDIGMVLANFNKYEYLKKFNFSDEVYQEVLNATFESPDWNELDRGAVSHQDMLKCFINNAPDYKNEIEQIFKTVELSVEEYDYAEELLKTMKQRGYKIYLLSNYGKETFAYAKKTMKFFQYTDGEVISYQIMKTKPEPEIYEEIIRKYSLIPKECVFLDDSAANIEAAKKFGFHTIVFESYEQGIGELEELLLNCSR